jgi:hypothetical protein
MIKKLKLTGLKIELEEVLIESDDSVVEVSGVAVDDEMVGKKSVDFHEPICIEGDTFSDFTGGQVLLFGEVLFVVKGDDDVPVLFVSS